MLKIKEKIEEFAQRYVEEHIEKHYPENKKNRMLTDSWEALKFLLSKIYNQGRRDEVSSKVEKIVIDVLENVRNRKGNIFDANEINHIKNELAKRIGKGHVGKGRDIEMTVEVLEFISKIESNNVVKYSLEQIKGGRISGHYEELKKIISIGDKIASFYLRDLVTLYHLTISERDFFLLQPIDTWVKQISEKLKIIDKNEDRSEAKRKIIAFCQGNGLSPIQFNQGVWYMGKNALKILLEEFNKEQPSKTETLPLIH